MGFALKFHLDALSEWDALDKGVRYALKKKLAKRLEEPHVPASALAGSLHGCYKIKHNKTGHRLVYHVNDTEVVVLVLAVGARTRFEAYESALERLLG